MSIDSFIADSYTPDGFTASASPVMMGAAKAMAQTYSASSLLGK